MIQMTPLMKDLLDMALADGTPCLVGTASKDGRPQISPMGSVAVFNDDTLCHILIGFLGVSSLDASKTNLGGFRFTA